MCTFLGGVETGSVYVRYVRVILANVPCTYYIHRDICAHTVELYKGQPFMHVPTYLLALHDFRPISTAPIFLGKIEQLNGFAPCLMLHRFCYYNLTPQFYPFCQMYPMGLGLFFIFYFPSLLPCKMAE